MAATAPAVASPSGPSPRPETPARWSPTSLATTLRAHTTASTAASHAHTATPPSPADQLAATAPPRGSPSHSHSPNNNRISIPNNRVSRGRPPQLPSPLFFHHHQPSISARGWFPLVVGDRARAGRTSRAPVGVIAGSNQPSPTVPATRTGVRYPTIAATHTVAPTQEARPLRVLLVVSSTPEASAPGSGEHGRPGITTMLTARGYVAALSYASTAATTTVCRLGQVGSSLRGGPADSTSVTARQGDAVSL